MELLRFHAGQPELGHPQRRRDDPHARPPRAVRRRRLQRIAIGIQRVAEATSAKQQIPDSQLDF